MIKASNTRRDAAKSALGGFRRWGAAAVIVAAALGGATTVMAESLPGLYLAGRHAEQINDFEAASRFYRRALAFAPQDQQLMNRAVTHSVLSGRPDMAMGIAADLAEIAPSDRIAMLALTADDLRYGLFDSALRRLEERGETALSSLMFGLLKAWISHGVGDSAAADATLDSMDDDALTRVFAEYHRGLLRSARGDHAGAVNAYEAALAAGGRLTARVGLAYGAALERIGKTEHAMKIYTDVLAEDPRHPVLRSAVARLEAGEGEAPLLVASAEQGAAEALYGFSRAVRSRDRNGHTFSLIYAQFALYARPDLTAAQLLVAGLLSDLGQHEPAAAMFDRVARDSPSYGLAQMGRAHALRRLDRVDDALTALNSLAERDGAESTVFFTIGEILSGEERFDECVAAYDEGVGRADEVIERDWVIFFSRGICLERSGDWTRAEADFEMALSLNPDQPDVLNYLGYSLVEQGARFDEARDMIERAVEKRPDSGYIVDLLGWVLYRLGDFDSAVRELERAVEMAPVEPVINDHLGDALWMVNRRLEAEFQWRRALSFNPEDKDRKRIERKLDVGLDIVLREEALADKDEHVTKADADDAPEEIADPANPDG